VRQDLILQLRKFFEQYDGWLVPASCGPAVTHDNVDKPREINGASVAYMSAVASHVAPFNLSGSPAVTIPAALSSDGLPIGLQLVGRPWQDMQLLRLAQCIEQVIGRLPSAPAVSE
jgi:Asp-tRNA(Asn)/Glu-tRNA(Gln) amidotransferase A subunit family amidase